MATSGGRQKRANKHWTVLRGPHEKRPAARWPVAWAGDHHHQPVGPHCPLWADPATELLPRVPRPKRANAASRQRLFRTVDDQMLRCRHSSGCLGVKALGPSFRPGGFTCCDGEAGQQQVSYLMFSCGDRCTAEHVVFLVQRAPRNAKCQIWDDVNQQHNLLSRRSKTLAWERIETNSPSQVGRHYDTLTLTWTDVMILDAPSFFDRRPALVPRRIDGYQIHETS
jgi:hypothetical protein